MKIINKLIRIFAFAINSRKMMPKQHLHRNFERHAYGRSDHLQSKQIILVLLFI